MEPRPHIFNLDPESLSELLQGWGMAKFRSTQVLEWVYRRHVVNPAEMTNISASDRLLLSERMRFLAGTTLSHQVASDGVQKLLIDWSRPQREVVPDSDKVEPNLISANAPLLRVIDHEQRDSNLHTECVMIPAESANSGTERRTACISSQVGCPVGCRFCASGIGGLDGNLTAGQIVEQVWRLGALDGVDRISNVVFMGMGEPLANFDNVTRAIRTLMADWGLGISGRRITISTVGLPAQIRRLADLELPVTLALSLHAPDDDLRRKLIPWAEYVTIAQLIEACGYYFAKTGREITLEYILLGGVNDQPEHAHKLTQIARRLRANINLIRYNEVKGMPFSRPAGDDVHQFQAILRKAGVNTHIRASRGRDISAACGQLRHEHQPSATANSASGIKGH